MNKDQIIQEPHISKDSPVQNRDATYNIRLKDVIEQNEKKLSFLFENTQDVIFQLSCDGIFLSISPAVVHLQGIAPSEVEGKGIDFLVCPEDLQKCSEALETALRTGSKQEIKEFRARKKDGSWIWQSATVTPVYNEAGEAIGVVGTARDITKQKQAEEILYNEKELLKATLISVGDGVLATNQHSVVTMINPVAETLTGYAGEEAIGRPVGEIFTISNEYTPKKWLDPVSEVLRTGRILELDSHTLLLSKTRNQIPIEVTAAPILDRNKKTVGTVLVFRDFTDKREKQRQVEYLSFHDYLTGLYNRRYIEDALLRMCTPRNLPFSIVMIDINGLKFTNDAFGHDVGDLLIKTTAEILRSICRAEDIIARIGGDEFVILLPQTDEVTAGMFMTRIETAAANIKNENFIVSLAIGTATKTEKSQDPLEIQKLADRRMYQNKVHYGKIMRNQTIELVLRQINYKFDREHLHIDRVTQYAGALAEAMGFDENEVKEIKLVAQLHDIGKIVLPKELLEKPGSLTPEEMETVRTHSDAGYQILRGNEDYAQIALSVLHHHERWDGKGYPKGLAGDEIPLQARIIAICDAYEAMTSPRSYKAMLTHLDAIKELEQNAGTQFDPVLTRIFIDKVL